MTGRKGLVLDANILLRVVFGKQVLHILEKYENEARFYTPDVCFRDAQKYIPVISRDRRFDAKLSLSILDHTIRIVEQVDQSLYEECEDAARGRIGSRVPKIGRLSRQSLLLALPIWTEDQDFFGSGIATWTTDRVELYLWER